MIQEIQRVITHNIQLIGLRLEQGGIKVSEWKEPSPAVQHCIVRRESDGIGDVSLQSRTKEDQVGVWSRPVSI